MVILSLKKEDWCNFSSKGKGLELSCTITQVFFLIDTG